MTIVILKSISLSLLSLNILAAIERELVSNSMTRVVKVSVLLRKVSIIEYK